MTITSSGAESLAACSSKNVPSDLRVLDPTTFVGWDTLIEEHSDATFFHTAAWAKTLKSAYGFECRYLALFERHTLRALLPLMEASSWLRGRRGISLPFTDECSPLLDQQANPDFLLQAAMREGKVRGWKYLELRGGIDRFSKLPESLSFYSHSLRLGSAAEELFEKFDGSVRRGIRKAERSGITVECRTDLDAVRSYYRLHCRTRTKHGAPPQPFTFFQSLWECALQTGRGFIALAMKNHRAVAGAVFLQFQDRAIYKFSASDDDFQEFRGPNFVIWHALKRLIAAGVTELNFGKTSLSNEGLRRFKRHWAADESQTHYVRYCFAREMFVKMGDLAAGTQARLFALLPVFLSRWIGQGLYRHMT